MQDLFNPVTILLHVINAFILLAALYYLLYKPVRKYMAARSQGIDEQLKSAQDTQNKAEDQFAASQQKLKAADEEAITVISRSTQQANEQAQRILDAAKAETESIAAHAKQDIQTMMDNAHQTMADEAASLAMEIASEMLAREVKMEDHKQFVDDFIKKVG